MPIELTWDDPNQTVMRYTFSDPWEAEDFYCALEAGLELHRLNGSKPIDLIVDLTTSYTVLDELLLRIHFMPSDTHKVRRVVLVSDNAWMLKPELQVSPQIYVTANLEQAYELLYRQPDASLRR